MAPAFGTLSAMTPALWITVGIVFVVVLCIAFPILALVYVSKTLRARGAAESECRRLLEIVSAGG